MWNREIKELHSQNISFIQVNENHAREKTRSKKNGKGDDDMELGGQH